jgi:hypothetical protein
MDIFLKKLAEWSLQDWELSVELDSAGIQLYFHGQDMKMLADWESTAILKNDVELNKLLMIMRRFFDTQETTHY